MPTDFCQSAWYLEGLVAALGGDQQLVFMGTFKHRFDDEGHEVDPGLVVGDCPGIADEVFEGVEEGGS